MNNGCPLTLREPALEIAPKQLLELGHRGVVQADRPHRIEADIAGLRASRAYGSKGEPEKHESKDRLKRGRAQTMANPTDSEPHDPRILAWELDEKAIGEIAAAKTVKDGAAIVRRKSRVVGGFPDGLAEQLVHKLAALSPHDYRQIEAAVAMALYGSSSKETRERLARRRVEFRCADMVEPGCWEPNPVDDLADENGGPAKSNDAGRLLAHVESLGWKVWREE